MSLGTFDGFVGRLAESAFIWLSCASSAGVPATAALVCSPVAASGRIALFALFVLIFGLGAAAADERRSGLLATTAAAALVVVFPFVLIFSFSFSKEIDVSGPQVIVCEL